MEINGTMLNLEEEVKEIIENDPWTSNEVNKGWVLSHLNQPEWYEDMAFKWHHDEDRPLECIDWSWKIYADALREFGVVLFTQDQITGIPHTQKTRDTVRKLVEQYGLRNVTNEFAKQIREKYFKMGYSEVSKIMEFIVKNR